MSWYINHLLKNGVEIKTKSDIESDEYNDLIVVERKIKDLHNANIISDQELLLIDYVSDGKPMAHSKKGFGKNRMTIGKDFRNLCNKIGFYLGSYFTDDGYVEYMKEKYELTDEDVKKMINYMTSRYKNKLLRKNKKKKHD